MNLANVASIYKKGDSSNLANYRPISLLQSFYKVLASLVKERIDDAWEGDENKNLAAEEMISPWRLLRHVAAGESKKMAQLRRAKVGLLGKSCAKRRSQASTQVKAGCQLVSTRDKKL